ncbi:beta-carotene 15,15'-dioxygenase, Brp/Blh family [Sphingomonas sp. NPDC019816]|uniref:beta-carotene 15,15'-dioxygenase, Brp/Blh family n=1 Tax=Sphingomonas sp. NPDC019816 TaxID=3390679 RepID=UPI003D03F42D
MTRSAPLIGRGALVLVALAASAGPRAGQLVFAILALGVVGMAHGASDLGVVAPARRPAFLLFYAAVSLICLAWWTAFPAIALPLFLVASALHFAAEDAPDTSWPERCALGTGLIAAPALFHPGEYAALLDLAAGATTPPAIVTALRLVGGVASVMMIVRAGRRRDGTLAVGTAALLLLPPLVGFSVGFLILHALPQTEARRRHMALASQRAYLRAIAPVLIAALLIGSLVGLLFLRIETSGVRGLFAAIAALAMPHLLVTPAFTRPATRPAPSRAVGLGL